MEQKLTISAINVKHPLIKTYPSIITLSTVEEGDEKRIFEILKKCDVKGMIKNDNLENLLMPEFSSKKFREVFYVEQILYKCQDWDRFNQYSSVNGEIEHGGAKYTQYVMPFNEFELRERPKEIFLDFHESIRPEMK